MNFNLEQVQAGLRAEGIEFEGKKDTLNDIALRNDTTPMAIYEIIKPYRIEESPDTVAGLTPEALEAKLSGTGLGRKSIEAICTENGIDLVTGLERLDSAGIPAEASSKARELAELHSVTPIDLVKIMMFP